MANSLSKSELRKIFSKKRALIPKETKDTADEKIAARLFSLSEYRLCDVLLTYASLKSEVSTKKIIDTALYDRKTVALPKTMAHGIMSFLCIDNTSDLLSGAYGIAEPREDCKPFKGGNAICIIPALAYAKSGHRLGYGGGYYDRYLQNFSGIKIGLCYDELLVPKLPYDSYDIAVDMIITERSIYKINAQ